ncbi:M15 family metallopeptidase [Nocardia sp. 2]|uniref:M15 family metallopeptidase n=1 Tax=Nocardia acididurans TaxID=2802282 RepID=A0ABS1M0A9_9NOCA|nr:M15 family metallopeptidase [Nocardia acididurans]
MLCAGAGLTGAVLPVTAIAPAAHAAPAAPAEPGAAAPAAPAEPGASAPAGPASIPAFAGPITVTRVDAATVAALLADPAALAALLVPAEPALPSATAIAGTDGLDPQLAAAYNAAAAEAQAQGVSLYVNSGYRSPAEQQALWEDGLATYGSPDETRKWVLPPEESTHVSGQAIDVGPRSGAQWLEDNGYRWGLCRTFDNEWWHFERVTVPGTACPARVPDAAHRGTPQRPGDNPNVVVPPGLPALPPELQALLSMLGSSVR